MEEENKVEVKNEGTELQKTEQKSFFVLELTPEQEEFFKKMKEFWTQDVDWDKFKEFMLQDVNFEKMKEFWTQEVDFGKVKEFWLQDVTFSSTTKDDEKKD